MLHAETLGLFVWRASFQTGAGAAGALTLGWKHHSEGGLQLAYTQTTVLPSWERRGHMEGKGVIVQGETCHARNVHAMNKFTSNQCCHSLIEQIYLEETGFIECQMRICNKRRQSQAWVRHYVPFHLASEIWSAVMMRGKLGNHKEPTFNLGEITKGGRKTALDGRMPLGRLCCYYVGEGCWAAVWGN